MCLVSFYYDTIEGSPTIRGGELWACVVAVQTVILITLSPTHGGNGMMIIDTALLSIDRVVSGGAYQLIFSCIAFQSVETRKLADY